MELNIPERFKKTIERLASAPPEEIERIKAALSSIPVHIKPEVMEERAKASASAKSIPDLDDIFQAIGSLTIARFRVDAPLDEFVQGITKSLKAKPIQGEQGSIEEKFKSLLTIDSIVSSARAFDIQHEYEKVLKAARIITDIRPVFDVAGTQATGAMIVHNLSIGYAEGGHHKEIVFAMDDADIASLKKIIERAESKSKISESLIQKAGVHFFESK